MHKLKIGIYKIDNIYKLYINKTFKMLIAIILTYMLAAKIFNIEMFNAYICYAETVTDNQDSGKGDNLWDEYSSYDYSKIDNVLKQSGYDGSFEDILNIICNEDTSVTGNGNAADRNSKLQKGIISGRLVKIADEVIGNTFRSNKETIVQIILLSVFSAAVNCFTPAFNKDQVSKMAQLIINLALIGILLASFISSCKISTQAIETGIEIYKAVIPVFFTTVAAVSGNVTAAVYYNFILMLITFVNIFFKNVLLPVNKIYIVFSMSDSITEKEYFTRAAALVPSFIKISCKAAMIFFTGLSGIKAMAAPASDSLKRKLLYKAVQAIPVVGGSMDTIGQTVLGAGAVIKNGIGVAAIIIIIAVCSIPLLKLVVFSCMLKVSAAAVEPVADKMIVKVVGSIADATGLMALIVLTSSGLFILMTAIICMI